MSVLGSLFLYYLEQPLRRGHPPSATRWDAPLRCRTTARGAPPFFIFVHFEVHGRPECIAHKGAQNIAFRMLTCNETQNINAKYFAFRTLIFSVCGSPVSCLCPTPSAVVDIGSTPPPPWPDVFDGWPHIGWCFHKSINYPVIQQSIHLSQSQRHAGHILFRLQICKCIPVLVSG